MSTSFSIFDKNKDHIGICVLWLAFAFKSISSRIINRIRFVILLKMSSAVICCQVTNNSLLLTVWKWEFNQRWNKDIHVLYSCLTFYGAYLSRSRSRMLRKMYCDLSNLKTKGPIAVLEVVPILRPTATSLFLLWCNGY